MLQGVLHPAPNLIIPSYFLKYCQEKYLFIFKCMQLGHAQVFSKILFTSSPVRRAFKKYWSIGSIQLVELRSKRVGAFVPFLPYSKIQLSAGSIEKFGSFLFALLHDPPASCWLTFLLVFEIDCTTQASHKRHQNNLLLHLPVAEAKPSWTWSVFFRPSNCLTDPKANDCQ